MLIVLAFVGYRFYIACIFYRQIDCDIVSKPTYDADKEEFEPPEDWYDHGDSWDSDWGLDSETMNDEKVDIINLVNLFKPDDNYSPEIDLSGKDLKKLGLTSEKYTTLDENGLPQSVNNDGIDDNKLYKISILELIPHHNSELFGSEKEKILLKIIEKIKPNNFNDIKIKLIPAIKKMMSKKEMKNLPNLTQRKTLPQIEHQYERDSSFLHNYWYLLSKAFIKNEEYENALLISHAIFYVNKYNESNFLETGSMISRLGSIFRNSRACDAILIWAHKPKANCIELSKAVALDILDFVERDGSLASNLEFENLNLTDKLEIQCKKGYYSLDWYIKSTEYKNIMDLTYKYPQKIIDKPIAETTKEFEKLEKDYSNYLDNCSKQTNPFNLNTSAYSVFISYIINPYKALNVRFFKENDRLSFIKDLKKCNELLLAKMELTSIALAINAYVSENKRYPESMDELSKWFGEKLPNNRFTKEPYKLDFNGKHLLYNNGIDGKEDLSCENSDDIFFDFSLND